MTAARQAVGASGAARGVARTACALAVALCVPLPVAAGDVEGAAQPGAYCPLPEKGEVPRCLDPAQEAYGSFFSALEQEDAEDEDAALAPVEEAVSRGAGDAQAYLALSSLTYGYYRLASRAAAADDVDPDVARRLARWNDLLALAWSRSPDDEPYRQAVQRAAQDLQQRAPVRLPCRDAEGRESECSSTENVLRGFNVASEEAGIRGALKRVLQRLFGKDDA